MSSDPKAGPADGHNPALVRGLKVAVAGMGLLIVAGLGAVIWRIVELASSPKPVAAAIPAPAAAAPAEASKSPSVAAPELVLELPAGSAVKGTTLSADRLAVHYEGPGGAGIAIVDLATGRVLSRIGISAASR